MKSYLAYIRLIVLVLGFEVCISILVGLGLYAGFSIFPYTQTPVMTSGTVMQTEGIRATLPLYMPTLSDLKIPYTQLQTGSQVWGITAFLVSGGLLVLQSFIRGMYLGGLKGWAQHRKAVPLLSTGVHYFKGMLAWTLLQNVAGLLSVLMVGVFFPISLILIITLLFFLLTPYLMIIQDITLADALAKAPRIFRRYFRKLLPLSIFAMLCTLIISLLPSGGNSFGYMIPLLAYSVAGTLLIGELMRQLIIWLEDDGDKVPQVPFEGIQTDRIKTYLYILMVPVLAISGVYAASGRHLIGLDFGNKKEIAGTSYTTNFSDVFYVTEQNYTTYEWKTNDYKVSMKLPELSGGHYPKVVRGIADITWDVEKESRIVNGSVTEIDFKPVTHKSKLLYRLVRETAADGSIYYSSLAGFASMLPDQVRLREPLSVQMLVSGNGTQIFVLQYPTKLDARQLIHVSTNGRYLMTSTSQINPIDIHAYWF